MSNYLVGPLLVIGTFFLAVGSFGILRLPDLYCRLHAQTKAGTLGIVGILVGAIAFFHVNDVTMLAVLTIAFQFLTSPVGAHMIARSAHARKVGQWSRTVTDELARDKAAGKL